MLEFLSGHWLDILTTVLGLIYIWLEYRASIALWVVGIIMPALDIYLYWSHGLYGDAGMACYYTMAALYGFYVWKFKKTRKLKQELPIIHMPRRQYLPATVCFFGLGSHLLHLNHMDQFYCARTRFVYQCYVVHRHVGTGSQVS